MGRLFDIEAAATRVAVGRLVKQGFIESVARGTYSIGPQGRLMAETASSWMEAELRLRPWSGGWIVVHSSHLGRTNKTALRARERAFRLNGFAELVAGLWCRPDNFREPPSATRDRLLSLGLEDDAVIRQINADPLLPDEMIDATARREMISAMVAYNELGSSAWSSFRRADPGSIDSDRA